MRKHVLWATTLLTIVLQAEVMVSDLFLRTHDYKAEGSNPQSWDLVGSVMLLIWLFVFIDAFLYRDRN